MAISLNMAEDPWEETVPSWWTLDLSHDKIKAQAEGLATTTYSIRQSLAQSTYEHDFYIGTYTVQFRELARSLDLLATEVNAIAEAKVQTNGLHDTFSETTTHILQEASRAFREVELESDVALSYVKEIGVRLESLTTYLSMLSKQYPQKRSAESSFGYHTPSLWATITISLLVAAFWYKKGKNTLRRMLSYSLKEGYSRIEWTCGCGDHLTADIKENTEGSLAALARQLNGRLVAGPAAAKQITHDSDFRNGGSIQDQHIPTSRPPLHSPDPSASVVDHTETPAWRISDTGTRSRVQASVTNPQWLEICVPSKQSMHDLVELDIAGPQTDRSVFRRIREKYDSLRPPFFLGGFKARCSKGGSFVQFRKDRLVPSTGRMRVAIMKRDSMPTKQEAQQYHYLFDPVPMDEPPMPADTFHHYFSKPHEILDEAAWVMRFPKLNDSSLNFNGKRLAKGWGIEILEERNWTVLVAANTLLVFASGVVAAIYARTSGDNQTAVAIGAWLSTVQALITSTVFYRWTSA